MLHQLHPIIFFQYKLLHLGLLFADLREFLIDFLKNKKKIQESITKIKKMQLELNITIGIDDILSIFKNSLKNKSIKWI